MGGSPVRRTGGAPWVAVALMLLLGESAWGADALDGVYSEAQAARGATLYARDCALCHGVGLNGGEAGPPLIGMQFLERWTGRPLLDLYEETRLTMPVDNPDGLSRQAYADLTAFMLQANGYPASAESLPAAESELAAITLVRPQASAPAAASAADANRASTGREGEWRHYHADLAATHYSPLDLIDRDNVAGLEIVWRWSARNFGAQPEFNYQVTPIMVDGVLYATAGRRRAAVAIDAATGETLWMYRLDEGERGQRSPRINSGRGVSYWEDPETGDARILFVTPGYHLIALDANSGQPIQSFGNKGIVDLKQGLDQDVDPVDSDITKTSPPLVVGNTVVVGAAFGPQGSPRQPEWIAGHIRGYDVLTGERKWIFHTIPKPGQYGYDTWLDGSAEYTGHAGAWAPLSADPELGLVYIPVEAPTHDFYGGHRPGDNLFSGSVVALDVETGERRWHYQITRNDIWDYDMPAAPVLGDLMVDGESVPALMQVTKMGLVFAFHRATGEPIWPIEERPVPQSDVPGEQTAATQPFPTRPPPYERIGVSEDDLIDFTPEIREEALRIVSNMRLGPLYTPPSLFDPDGGNRGTLMLPGYGGGSNWQGAVFDPETGVLYVPSVTHPHLVGLVHDPSRSEANYVMAGQPLQGPFGLPLIQPPWGRITAIDMNRGEHLWMMANADTPEWVRDHERLQGVDLPRTGHRDRGGLLVTRTLLFAGEGAGMFVMPDGGNMFRAHDKLTGEIVAEIELPARQTGLPMTYALDGRQYIVVPIGAPGHPAEFVALSVAQ